MTRLVNEPCPSYMRSGVTLLHHDPACGGSGLIKTKPFFNDGSLGHEFRRLVYHWTIECSFPLVELFQLSSGSCDSSVDQDAGVYILPERDKQLASQRNNCRLLLAASIL